MLLVLLLYIDIRALTHWGTLRSTRSAPLEPIRALGFSRSLEGRVAFIDLLAILIFNMSVQLQDALNQVVEEGVNVLARVDHRLFHLHLIHRALRLAKLLMELRT